MQAVLYGPTGAPLNPQTPAIVDPSGGAIRASLKQLEYALPGYTGGHYRTAIYLNGGITTSIGASSPLVAFRWAPSTAGLLAVVKKISASVGLKTVGSSAAIIASLDTIRATGFTVQDTGGSAITFGLTQKLRSSMGNSQAALYYATGSTVISATAVLVQDTQPFGLFQLDEQPVTTGVIRMGNPGDIYKDDTQGAHAEVFSANEGFLLRFTAAQGTSAVTDAIFVIEWAEALQY